MDNHSRMAVDSDVAMHARQSLRKQAVRCHRSCVAVDDFDDLRSSKLERVGIMEASFEWDGRKLTVMRSEYQYGSCKQLALLCFDNDDWECSVESGMPYGVLTVNLDAPQAEPLADDAIEQFQFLDVNNWPGIEKVLENCDWAEDTSFRLQSGFVTYPLYAFSSSIPHI